MITTAFVLSSVLLQVQALNSDRRPCPYVLVTTAGERFGTLDLPKHDGKPVKFRLCTNATLTVYPAADVDWVATEKANASGPAPTPASGIVKPTPRQSLSGFAKQTSLRDADAAVKQNEASGKLKTAGGKEIDLEGRNFFGKESVAAYLELGTFLADTSTCPTSRAVAYGVVKNISRVKLRDLKAYVVIGSLHTGQHNGQVQTMDPSNLMPGEKAKIFLYLSCDFIQGRAGSSSGGADESTVVLLPDVGGKPEALERPDGSNPSETPASAKTAAPPRTPPASSPLGSATPKPR
jgi:hypothetical protein